MHPGAEVGEFAVVPVPSGTELRLGPMIAVGGPHRPDDRQFIDVPGEVRKPVADLDAGFAMRPKIDLQGIERIPLVAVAVGNDQPFEGQLLGILSVGKRRLGNRLAGIFVEHRFGIEALHVADAAVHEQPDHALGLGSQMGPAGRRSPARVGSAAILLQQGCQCDRGQSIAEKRSPRQQRRK